MGLVNNLGYVMVGTTAKKLSAKFGKDTFLGLFQLYFKEQTLSCLIIFNGAFRIINSRFFIKITHSKRLKVNFCAMIVGYILIAVSAYSDSQNIVFFVICLIASVIHGLTSCFGESVILGYLKGFPADLVVGWSSGTGFAGVVGAGLVVILFAFEFPLFAVLCFS